MKNRISGALFVSVALFPLIAVALLATAIYAECNHKVPVNIECQTDLPDDNCTGNLRLVCEADTKLVDVFENDFGRQSDPESNEHTVHTTDPEDEENCYKYKTCKWALVGGCSPDVEKVAKAPIYVGEEC